MKWLRNILKGVSLTAALFVFQACYGAPQVPDEEVREAELVQTKAEEAPAEEEAVAETPVVQAE